MGSKRGERTGWNLVELVTVLATSAILSFRFISLPLLAAAVVLAHRGGRRSVWAVAFRCAFFLSLLSPVDVNLLGMYRDGGVHRSGPRLVHCRRRHACPHRSDRPARRVLLAWLLRRRPESASVDAGGLLITNCHRAATARSANRARSQLADQVDGSPSPSLPSLPTTASMVDGALPSSRLLTNRKASLLRLACCAMSRIPPGTASLTELARRRSGAANSPWRRLRCSELAAPEMTISSDIEQVEGIEPAIRSSKPG